MDMGGHSNNVNELQQRFPHSKVIRYYSTHLETIRRCIAQSRTEFTWVISSCCQYDKFDFDYKLVPWEANQIHCWASDEQVRGDTFLIPTDEFKKQQEIEQLEWYHDINYRQSDVTRMPMQSLLSDENITAALKDFEFTTPYVEINARTRFTPCLWKDRAFYSLNDGGSVSLAPREIKAHLLTQIYDYPHIIKQKETYYDPKPHDIIFISNNEPGAEYRYDHLRSLRQGQDCKRVMNVNGRVAAYKAAAELSTTPWFFAVFAKVEVASTFDFNWQADYLQEPKHYIFHSKNPVNGLEYGHQGIIAYNKQLVLDTAEHGLDFTLSKPHAVVPILSGVARYNTTPELTWRTAFREVLKLQDDVIKTGSIESAYRLRIWLTVATGNHSAWSIKGAEDAIAYYDSVSGDYDKLLLSFDWAWPDTYFTTKYND